MTADAWTADDLQPGDLNEVLAAIDPRFAQHREGEPTATLQVLVGV